MTWTDCFLIVFCVFFVISLLIRIINTYCKGEEEEKQKTSPQPVRQSKRENDMGIDIEKLRKHMIDNDYALYFTGDFGGAIAEMADVENASDEELIEMAKRQGIDLKKYEAPDAK